METLEIGQGIKLHLIKTEKFKTTVINVLIRRRLTREEVTINALIPNILKKDCKKYGSLSEMNSAVEKMYGAEFDAQVIKKGEEQILQFYMEVLDRHLVKESSLLDEAFQFLSELLLNPKVEGKGFNQKTVEGEVKILKETIEGRINNKAEYAKLRCVAEMCKDEPFGLYGDGYSEDLKDREKVSAENIYKQYKKLIETSPIEFLIIGNEDINNLAKIIKENFKIERKELINLETPKIDHEKKDVLKVEENLNLSQGKICLGLRCGVEPVGEDFYKLVMFNEILGGGANSKLFVNVREKESLCYAISSFVYRFKSILFIQSGVAAENFDKIVKHVENEIKNIKSGEITDEELVAAKKGLVKKFDGMKDYPSAIVDYYFTQSMVKDKDTIEEAANKIKNVSKEDVSSIAEKIVLDTVYTLR